MATKKTTKATDKKDDITDKKYTECRLANIYVGRGKTGKGYVRFGFKDLKNNWLPSMFKAKEEHVQKVLDVCGAPFSAGDILAAMPAEEGSKVRVEMEQEQREGLGLVTLMTGYDEYARQHNATEPKAITVFVPKNKSAAQPDEDF